MPDLIELPPPARWISAERARPVLRRLDVTTTLADFAIVTHDVAPEALARLLPAGFVPEVVTLPSGERRTGLSGD
jgi:hypothetical protein